ncbi:MAG: InlB B-repeat-containing protein [Ruminococcus sp.]|nr:InlB B-repeat-containing protein [Ruminococcus sp.]
MKKGLLSILAVALAALCLFVCSLADISLFSDSSAEISIFCDDAEISEISFSENDHITIEARTSVHGDYQWQILTDGEIWADISHQTAETIELSHAMTKAVSNDGQGVYVRCTLTNEGSVIHSEPVCVNVNPAPVKAKNSFTATPMKYSAAAVLADENFVTITVNYLDSESKDPIFSPYTATITSSDTSFVQNIISPTFIGYIPKYNPDNPSTDTVDENMVEVYTLNLNLASVTESLVYNIYYVPTEVPYAAKYYFQNIYDDQYTENVGFYKQDYALTGTIISDNELTNGVNSIGFTKLYHYPESVAADGSTVFECYYDRNYYLLKFDMNGGYGVDPIYARYDTPFVVNEPIRHGYVFAGWDLLDAEGKGDGIADVMPSRIPAENRNYRAVWTVTKTSYTKVYWLQDPDEDDKYNYWGSQTVNDNVYSASLVSGSDDVPDNFEDKRYTQFSHADQNVEVDGDGSTVVNIYYNRKEYTLKFYYARYKNGNYGIVGGSTWYFAWSNNSNDNLAAQLENVPESQWGNIVALPSLNALGLERNYQTGAETYNNVTYHYLTFSAKYGEYIGDIWPIGIFDSITTSTLHTQGDTAYFSAWNVEHHTYYSVHNENKTLKGNYLRLDYQMLYDASQYADRSTICFLAFWENGANISWSRPNQWLYNIYLPILEDEEADRNYLGIDYKLFATYDTCDNNTTSNPNEQTATAIEGFTYSRRNATTNPSINQYRDSYNMDFYYTRNNYTLEFNNNGTIIKQETVPFETKLKKYNFTPPYPTNLEENGYYFEGWYTSPGCYEGTKLDWDTATMPASNLMLYANWLPKTHTINVFKTYAAMEEYEKAPASEKAAVLERLSSEGLYLESLQVVHGNTVSTLENPDSMTDNGVVYDFAGWFYMDTGTPKAYTPLDMPVTGDMNIFAEWGSKTPRPYVIHYALDNRENDSSITALLDAKRGNNATEHMKYTVTVNGSERSYVWLNNGYHLCIAGSTTGYGYQGTTRTFRPKAGAPYNQLEQSYNSGYFPTVGSHSITMQYEADVTSPQTNVYTFTYIETNELEYTVRYINKNTGEELHTSKTAVTSNAVITERFVPIEDFIPDAFYKRLVLSVEEDPNNPGEFISSSSNVIIFYYTPNTRASYYAVHFMLETSNGNYEDSGSTIEGVGDTGSTIGITPLDFNGFILNNPAWQVINDTETSVNLNNGQFNITIDESGTELYIYYRRQTQSYTTYYLRYGADITDLTKLDESDILEQSITKSDIPYGSTVIEHAPDIDGYRCVSSNVQSITLGHDNDKNRIIFYYSPLQYTMEYRIAGGEGGILSRTSETIEGDTEIVGSEVRPNAGYLFEGWYADEACTIKVGDNVKFTPDKTTLSPQPDVNIYYAKLTPQYGSITISRDNADDEGNGKQVFVYRVTNNSTGDTFEVTVNGNDSTTITNLLYGKYTVEQLNDWSWRYSDSSQQITLENDSAEVTFNKAADEDLWLSGNSDIEKNVKEAD